MFCSNEFDYDENAKKEAAESTKLNGSKQRNSRSCANPERKCLGSRREYTCSKIVVFPVELDIEVPMTVSLNVPLAMIIDVEPTCVPNACKSNRGQGNTIWLASNKLPQPSVADIPREPSVTEKSS